MHRSTTQRLIWVGAAVGLLLSVVFSYVGSFFYGGTALRLFSCAFPPYVLFLAAGWVSGPGGIIRDVTALGLWLSILLGTYSYVHVLFFMPPDGQKVMIFLIVGLGQTLLALLLLVLAGLLRVFVRRTVSQQSAGTLGA